MRVYARRVCKDCFRRLKAAKGIAREVTCHGAVNVGRWPNKDPRTLQFGWVWKGERWLAATTT